MRQVIARAEGRASKLLNELNLSRIPTPLEEIAQRHKIRISYDLGDDMSGVLVVKSDNAVIGVNSTESSVRQRFTIAHELGHYFMHREKAELFVDKDHLVLKRSGDKDPIELEANAFAAALLMPENLIEGQLKTLGNAYGAEEKIKILAKRFEVSTIAMTYRLSNLGLLS